MDGCGGEENAGEILGEKQEEHEELGLESLDGQPAAPPGDKSTTSLRSPRLSKKLYFFLEPFLGYRCIDSMTKMSNNVRAGKRGMNQKGCMYTRTEIWIHSPG